MKLEQLIDKVIDIFLGEFLHLEDWVLDPDLFQFINLLQLTKNQLR